MANTVTTTMTTDSEMILATGNISDIEIGNTYPATSYAGRCERLFELVIDAAVRAHSFCSLCLNAFF
jgi:hypothetical protein